MRPATPFFRSVYGKAGIIAGERKRRVREARRCYNGPMLVAPRTSLRTRQFRPEVMDQPDLDPAEHRRALQGLATVNRVSRSAAILWRPLRRLARRTPSQPLRVLDLACGGGDVTVALAYRAARAGLALRIDGCDLSAVAIEHAAERAARSTVNVDFFRLDVVREPLPDGYDVLCCSLFLHHLDEPTAVALLERMAAAARRLVLVNDLRRSAAGYWLAWLGCRLLARSPIVHVDGPRSIENAFTIPEARALAHRAGLKGAELSRHWPQRFLLSWRRL